MCDSHETKVSSHFVVGYEGEIVQCVPSTEIAYASNSRNEDTLSIECCHLDETGEFTNATYISLVRLTGWQCVPSTEIAYASNSRNEDTLSIECCHLDETGEFTNATYISLVRLTGWLCWRFNLTEEDVIRHYDVTGKICPYDVTGKICPKYYVENPNAWEQFKEDVKIQIQKVDEEVKASKGE